jgi:hypothetical protein
LLLVAGHSVGMALQRRAERRWPGRAPAARRLPAQSVAFSTPLRAYRAFPSVMSSLRCPGDYADAAVLEVSAQSGVTWGTREDIALLSRLGVGRVFGFVDHYPDNAPDPDLAQLAELELREELQRHGFAGDEAPVSAGSLRRMLLLSCTDDDACRCVDELLAALDGCGVLPADEPRRPARELWSILRPDSPWDPGWSALWGDRQAPIDLTIEVGGSRARARCWPYGQAEGEGWLVRLELESPLPVGRGAALACLLGAPGAEPARGLGRVACVLSPC